MVNGIKDALEATPPELSADLVDMGLTLTGGGALLKNIDKRFSKETGLPVHIAEDPLSVCCYWHWKGVGSRTNIFYYAY